jgi:protein subunit release factor B
VLNRLREEDLQESFCRAGGPGGQNVNKVNTAVLLVHLPTGLQVRAQTARTQEQNRQLARQRLAALLEKRKLAARAAVQSAILETKRRRSQVKLMRRVSE